MAQPITDYAAFFAGAKQAIHEMELLKQRETQLQNLENEVETSLKTKQKSVSDQITMTVKQRTDEIIKSYDAEIGKSNDRLKKVRVKREKAKSQGVKERIAEDTSGLLHENKELKRQLKTVLRADHVPRVCSSKFYYSLYFTKGFKELMILLLTMVICFLAIPCGIYFMIQNRQVLHLVLIYVLTILVFGGLYVVVGNATKMKHLEALREGRKLRNRMVSNKKQMKKITKSIRKDKDEAIYNLEKFDDEIAQLEQDIAQAERQKKDALHTFETVTKTIISDEIMGTHRAELTQMESDLAKTCADLKEIRNAAMNKALYITDNYEVYVGKEFMSIHRMEMLEAILQSGKASNMSEAITIFKSKEYQNNHS